MAWDNAPPPLLALAAEAAAVAIMMPTWLIDNKTIACVYDDSSNGSTMERERERVKMMLIFVELPYNMCLSSALGAN
jgi:hypothetical protein